jgi:transposase
MLARVARMDPALLFPIRHRSGDLQADLAVLRARQSLVKARAQQINHVRGAVKSMGERLPKCSAGTFAKKVAGALPAELAPALSPLLDVIAGLTRKIREYDKRLERMADESYPESMLLRQVRGVGVLTALAYLLVIGDPSRFQKSRTVGAYLGLTPGLDESGDSRRVLRISKEGDRFLRSLLVQCAHYILGPFGADCDLRRHGEAIIQGGGRSPKKRASVAVARKLAVLLHRLWRNGEVYDPFHNANRQDRRLHRSA